MEVVAGEPTPTLIPLESLRIGRNPAAEGWVNVGPAADLPVDELSTTALNGVGVLVVNLGNRLSAYRNECAHEAMPLDDAVLDVSNGTGSTTATSGCASAAECQPFILR